MAVLRPEHAPLDADHDREPGRAARATPASTTCSWSRSPARSPPGRRRSSSSGCWSAACTRGPSWSAPTSGSAARAVRRRGHAARGGPPHDFVVEGIALDGGPQVWSSTYVRTCLAAGDVEGAAEALGRPFTRPRHRRRGDQRGRELGYPTANVPTRGRRGARRRRVRRLADAASTPARRYAGRDQRRHQPDVRRRARAPGRGLRAGPRRPRAVRRRGRGRLRRPDPRHGARSTASRRWSPTMHDDVRRARELLAVP